MTNEEREALVAHWLDSELDEAEDARTLSGYVSDEKREAIYIALSNQFDDVEEALLSNSYLVVAREADDLLKAADIARVRARYSNRSRTQDKKASQALDVPCGASISLYPEV